MPNPAGSRNTFTAPLGGGDANKDTGPKGPNVGYVRSEIEHMRPKWTRIADCLAGQAAVKAKGDAYLPRPNASNKTKENLARYDSYLDRAVFYSVTENTMRGLIGQVFSRDPIVVLPDVMKSMIEDVDGQGVTLDQQAKLGLGRNLSASGFGLLVDYPKLDRPITLAEQSEGNIYPTLLQYARGSIINWRKIKRGARYVFSLVVIEENGEAGDDGFEVSYEREWRVLQLDKVGEYVVTLYKWDEQQKQYYKVGEDIKPTGADGKPLTKIPFYFCGPLDNDEVPDEPMLGSLSDLNIGHYRNSADYEDSCYLVGQPTPYFAGLTESWVNKVFKNKPIELGSRAAIALPQGATAGLLQASENSMPMEAMKHKEAQMLALGAKIIEPGAGSNTLGEAQMDESTENSMLATAAKNVSAVYTLALKDAAELHGASGEISYSLNTDFPASRLTPNERNQLVLEWQGGAITETEMRAGLRKAGVATLEHEDYKKELKENPPPEPKAVTNNGGAGGADNKPDPNKGTSNNGGNQNAV